MPNLIKEVPESATVIQYTGSKKKKKKKSFLDDLIKTVKRKVKGVEINDKGILNNVNAHNKALKEAYEMSKKS